MTSPEPDIEQRIRALSCWQGSVSIQTLDGGITNANYLIQDSRGRFVVRLGNDIPEHHILRFNELSASRAAHAAGVSPAVHHHEPGVLVLEYLEARTLTPDAIRDERTLNRIVDLLRTAHRDVPQYLRGASVVFWVFHVIRDYAATLATGHSPHRARLPALLASATELERAAGPFDIVYGHNDLLAANLLDDGERLWLIDWEYAGFNTPLFDLGGLASNNELDEALQGRMLERYFERPLVPELQSRFAAMKCASLLRETLWSMVAEIHSTLEFDYSQYTRTNLARFELAMADFRTGT